jgi:hypothetical protein
MTNINVLPANATPQQVRDEINKRRSQALYIKSMLSVILATKKS